MLLDDVQNRAGGRAATLEGGAPLVLHSVISRHAERDYHSQSRECDIESGAFYEAGALSGREREGGQNGKALPFQSRKECRGELLEISQSQGLTLPIAFNMPRDTAR